MQLPFEPAFAGRKINTHLILEYIAFFSAFRYYLHLRKLSTDPITTSNRLSIILGAAIGAFIGSRIFGFLEDPRIPISLDNIFLLFQLKTIMGGLFGGMLGVELAKLKIGETRSSGDLFTLPLILGIFIGRIGCFLSGTNEFTYGKTTTTVFGINLGDGLARHPLALYELLFLLILFFILRGFYRNQSLSSGLIFQYFMLAYFGFRFMMEFLKPNTFFVIGLSSIQWLCILCYFYYRKTILSTFRYAFKKIHIL